MDYSSVASLLTLLSIFIGRVHSDECSNKYKTSICVSWKTYGSCETNKMVQVVCRKTCDLCPEETNGDQSGHLAAPYTSCEDRNTEEECKRMDTEGMCQRTYSVRAIQCRKTCQNCQLDRPEDREYYANEESERTTQPPETVTKIENKGCTDYNDSSCQFWAKNGYCQYNIRLRMLCSLSCQTCTPK